jgi:hypothetical protein
MEDNRFITCPFCKAQIRAWAIKCRFCRQWLETPFQPKPELNQEHQDNLHPTPTESDQEQTDQSVNVTAAALQPFHPPGLTLKLLKITRGSRAPGSRRSCCRAKVG